MYELHVIFKLKLEHIFGQFENQQMNLLVGFLYTTLFNVYQIN